MSLPIQAVQTLVSSLLQGQYAPTGIGTNPPARLGPDPNRSPSSGPATFNPGAASIDIMSVLAPYFALLGLSPTGASASAPAAAPAPAGTAGSLAGPAAGPAPSPAPAPGGDFLTQILTALLSPAATAGSAGSGEGGAGGGNTLANPTTPPPAGGGVEAGGGPGDVGSGGTGFEILR